MEIESSEQNNEIALLLCPFCKKDIPRIKIQEEKSNIALKIRCNCLESVKTVPLAELIEQLQNPTRKNNSCYTHNRTAEKYCLECSKWLCKECLMHHNEFASDDHHLIDNEVKVRCQKHKKDYALYCRQCRLNICKDCQSDHQDKDHHLISTSISCITSIGGGVLNIVDKRIEATEAETKKLIAKINNEINDLTKRLKELNEIKSKTIEMLNANMTINNQLKLLYQSIFTTAIMVNNRSYQMSRLLNTIKVNSEELVFTTIEEEKGSIKDLFIKAELYLMNQFVLNQIGTGECVTTLADHSQSVWQVIMLADGTLASRSYDRTIKVWDTTSSHCKITLEGHKALIWWITQLKNGLLASCTRDEIKLWELKTYQCIKTLKGHKDMYQLLELKERAFASISLNGSIHFWDSNDTNDYGCIWSIEAHSGAVCSLIQLKDGLLVSCSNDKTIKTFCFDPKSKSNSKECIQTFKGHSDIVWKVIELNDGTIASCSDDTLIKLWELETAQCKQTLIGHSDCVKQLLQLSNGDLVSGSNDASIKLWDLVSFQCKHTFIGHSKNITSLIQLIDSSLASCSEDHTIKIWNCKTTTEECTNTLVGHSDSVVYLIQLEDGLLASCSKDKSIKLWYAY